MTMRRMLPERFSLRDLATVLLPIVLIVAAAFWIAYQFIRPAPPDKVVITTGEEVGSYHTFAERYRDILARNDITLELRPSNGSADNLKRLLDDASNVDAGFVQAGITRPEDAPGLESLGSVYYEPIWVFYRAEKPIDRLAQLAGKRISIGREGGGTRALAMKLLQANEIADTPTTLLALPSTEAAEALVAGSIDAMIIVAGPQTGVVRALLYSPSIRLYSFSRAPAYTKLFPFLAVVKLPQGAIDLVRDIPTRDTDLLATTATVVVRDDFHPALAALMVQAMTEVHRSPGPLQKVGEFPIARNDDLPMNDEALHYYKSGPPFLQRYLPFWAATLVDRAVVLLLPLLAVLIPLMRIAPPLYNWRVRSKINRWYGELKFLEQEIRDRYDSARYEEYTKQLEALEDKAYARRIPLGFTDQVYTLRQHIDIVRTILARMSGRPDALPRATRAD